MRWKQRSVPDEAAAAVLAAELGLPVVITRLLTTRGITTPAQAQQFLAPAFTHLHSPYDMLGMSTAVERLDAALTRK